MAGCECRGGGSCGPSGVSTRCARPQLGLRPCRVTRRTRDEQSARGLVVRGHGAQQRPRTRGLFGWGGIELGPAPTHTSLRRLEKLFNTSLSEVGRASFPRMPDCPAPVSGASQQSSVSCVRLHGSSRYERNSHPPFLKKTALSNTVLFRPGAGSTAITASPVCLLPNRRRHERVQAPGSARLSKLRRLDPILCIEGRSSVGSSCDGAFEPADLWSAWTACRSAWERQLFSDPLLHAAPLDDRRPALGRAESGMKPS